MKQEEVIQNTNEVLSITADGDWTSDTVYFTLKSSLTSSTRIVDILVSDKTYDSGTEKTLFEVPLIPEQNQELISQKVYYWDLKTENSSTDRKLIKQGEVTVTHTVRRDSDIAPTEATPIISLNANDFNAESYFKVEDDGSGTNNIFVPKTITEMKAELGLMGLPERRYKFNISSENGGYVKVRDYINTLGVGISWTYSNGVYELSLDDYVYYPTPMSVANTNIQFSYYMESGRYIVATPGYGAKLYIMLFDASDQPTQFKLGEWFSCDLSIFKLSDTTTHLSEEALP